MNTKWMDLRAARITAEASVRASVGVGLAIALLHHGLVNCPDVTAQIVPDNTLGAEGSIVTTDVDINGSLAEQIEGGAIRGDNLFHSFRRFNIRKNQRVFFDSPTGIDRILSRVTGSDVSDILGTLGVNGAADLFFINPNGILFGPNSSLDIGGSFVASTADQFVFADDVTFGTTSLESPSLLAISAPVGLQYGIPQSGDITVTGSLSVNSGQSIALAGGNITVETATLEAPGGHIELIAVADAGIVALEGTGRTLQLDIEGELQPADVLVTNGSRVDVSDIDGRGGGSIHIQGRTVRIDEGSRIDADTLGNQNQVGILIQAEQVVVESGGQLTASVAEGGTGKGGGIRIDATESVEVVGTSSDRQTTNQLSESSSDSGSGNSADSGSGNSSGNGSGGGSGGGLGNSSGNGSGGGSDSGSGNSSGNGSGSGSGSGSGNGSGRNNGLGNDDVGNQTVDRNNGGGGGNDSGSGSGSGNSNSGGNGSGSGNDSDNGSGSSDSEGGGDGSGGGGGGNGSGGGGGSKPSKLSSDAQGPGIAGDLIVNTTQLVIRDGGKVTASTSEDNAQGGNILINASESVVVSGEGVANDQARVSAISIQIRNENVEPGNLVIETGRLEVQNGAEIIASTFSSSAGGSIFITATESVEVNGTSIIDSDTSSRITSETGVQRFFNDAGLLQGTGKGGNVTIATEELTIRDGGNISVSDLNPESEESVEGAGDLAISANIIRLNNQGEITAISPAGDGGNVKLELQDLLLLRRGSGLSVRSQSRGNGGDIDIDTTFLVAFADENSDITASAVQGNGGNIQITAQGIFGLEERPILTDFSDINASSDLGVDGVINLDTPEVDPTRGTAELPTDTRTAQVSQRCYPGEGISNFVATGRGGVPLGPEDAIAPHDFWEELHRPSVTSPHLSEGISEHQLPAEVGRSRIAVIEPIPPTDLPNRTIVEAQGWHIGVNGQVNLTESLPAALATTARMLPQDRLSEGLSNLTCSLYGSGATVYTQVERSP